MLHGDTLTDPPHQHNEDHAQCPLSRAVDDLSNEPVRSSTRARLKVPRDLVRRCHRHRVLRRHVYAASQALYFPVAGCESPSKRFPLLSHATELRYRQ